VAIIRERGRATFEAINHQGTVNVVAAAKSCGARRFVHMSAIGAADDPKFPYLQSKWRGEQAVTKSGVPYVILRGSILFGEGDEFVNTLAGLVKAFPLVPVIGPGRARFQPIHVQDVARCVVQALERDDLLGKAVSIGGPAYFTYDELIDALASKLGYLRWKAHVPVPVGRALVSVMEKALPHSPATSHELDMLALDNVADLDGVERTFGFTPRPLEGNIEYVGRISYTDAWKITFGFIPKHIRDQ
ncbi:MAG: NAD-dependent epimerase/dehydratase family protein, partial [Chloroflexota bacterium]